MGRGRGGAFPYRLQGALPPQWTALSALTRLNASGNAELGGPLPSNYSALSGLRALDLRGCNFTGVVMLPMGCGYLCREHLVFRR